MIWYDTGWYSDTLVVRLDWVLGWSWVEVGWNAVFFWGFGTSFLFYKNYFLTSFSLIWIGFSFLRLIYPSFNHSPWEFFWGSRPIESLSPAPSPPLDSRRRGRNPDGERSRERKKRSKLVIGVSSSFFFLFFLLYVLCSTSCILNEVQHLVP